MAQADSFSALHDTIRQLWVLKKSQPIETMSQLPGLSQRFIDCVRKLDAIAPPGLVFENIAASEACATLIRAQLFVRGLLPDDESMTYSTLEQFPIEDDIILICELLETCSAWLSKVSEGIAIRSSMQAVSDKNSENLTRLCDDLALLLSEPKHAFFLERLANPSHKINVTVRNIKKIYGFAMAAKKADEALGKAFASSNFHETNHRGHERTFAFGLGGDLKRPPYCLVDLHNNFLQLTSSTKLNQSWLHAAQLRSDLTKAAIGDPESGLIEESDKQFRKMICAEPAQVNQIKLLRDFTAGSVPLSMLYPNQRFANLMTNDLRNVEKRLSGSLQVSFFTCQRDEIDKFEKERKCLGSLSDETLLRLTVRAGAGFTRSSFLEADWRNVDIVHVASHGFAHPGKPECAHLVLHPSLSPNSLHYYDILQLDMTSVGLVILNCCFTGAGTRFSGTDSLSLGYAFLAAGASCVIATRWRLNDDVAVRFTETFYRKLVGQSTMTTTTVGESFYATIDAMRYESEFDNPTDWGAYELLC